MKMKMIFGVMPPLMKKRIATIIYLKERTMSKLMKTKTKKMSMTSGVMKKLQRMTTSTKLMKSIITWKMTQKM